MLRAARIALLPLALCAVMFVAAPAQAAPKYRTTVNVSLKFRPFTARWPRRAACKANRTVKVFRRRGGQDRRLEEIDQQRQGKWTAKVGNLTSGEYWTQATASGSCKAGKSKVLTID